MQLVAHGLGCSILTVAGLENPNFHIASDDGWGNNSVNVMREDGEGFGKLKTWLKKKERAGLILWVDTSTTDEDEVEYFDYSDERSSKRYVCSGRKFYNMLLSRGEHVEKTVSYKNPGHEGRCTVYWWYFRKRPKAQASIASATSSGGSAAEARGAKVAKKTKTATRRAAA